MQELKHEKTPTLDSYFVGRDTVIMCAILWSYSGLFAKGAHSGRLAHR